MTAPSESFDLPPELRARASEITGKYRMAHAMQMAEEMVDAGVPMNLAFQITVGELAVSAARVAMMACVGLEKREPRRDLWMKRAEENFDEAREWFANLQTEGRIDRCPICAEPFKADDICATDIELMTCHAACLEGSPVVDLDSGEPLPEGEIHTYRYGDETPPPQSNMRVRPATAEDVNKAFDPANEALGAAFQAGFREGWIYAEIDADGERYQEMAEEYALAVDIAPQEAWDAHRAKFFAMLPLAPIPEVGAPIADIEAEIASVVQSVNEWDDRTSPDDFPNHLLITSEELTLILRNFAATLEGK